MECKYSDSDFLELRLELVLHSYCLLYKAIKKIRCTILQSTMSVFFGKRCWETCNLDKTPSFLAPLNAPRLKKNCWSMRKSLESSRARVNQISVSHSCKLLYGKKKAQRKFHAKAFKAVPRTRSLVDTPETYVPINIARDAAPPSAIDRNGMRI